MVMTKKTQIITILVTALGYFVDVYDLLLFSIVRITSLRDLGIPEHELLSTGVMLLNLQMIGMLISALIVGLVCLLIAGISLWHMKETFGKDLDYVHYE
jgi:putative MFS transporter